MTTDNGPVLFWRTREPFGCFSNFSRHSVRIGRTWITSEHYYQAQKFLGVDPEFMDRIHKCKSAREAADLGRELSPLRHDWDDGEVKIDVMREVVRAKIIQNVEVRDALLSTGTRDIIEDSPIDWFWGNGKDKTGQNWLGRIYMEQREWLTKKVGS